MNANQNWNTLCALLIVSNDNHGKIHDEWREREERATKIKKRREKEEYIAKDANDVNSIEKYGIECAFTQNPHIHIKWHRLKEMEKREKSTHTLTKKPLQYNQRSIRNIPSKEIM